MSSNAERLAEAVLARRDELELTQLEVWLAGGPSNTTLTVIENKLTKTLTRTTARKLDAALRWAPGSARQVWEGKGDPIAVDPVQPPPVDIMAELEAAGVSAATLAYVKEKLAEDARLAAQKERESS